VIEEFETVQVTKEQLQMVIQKFVRAEKMTHESNARELTILLAAGNIEEARSFLKKKYRKQWEIVFEGGN
jgi:hypothetical protein